MRMTDLQKSVREVQRLIQEAQLNMLVLQDLMRNPPPFVVSIPDENYPDYSGKTGTQIDT